MAGYYDLRLVALSYIVATIASYTALDLAGRLTSARGTARRLWLAGGAFSMGLGIWAMHFIGMLAFRLDTVPIEYDVSLVVISLIVVIFASAGALYTMSQPQPRWQHLAIGGPLVGSGIAAMHYIGMAAMEMNATLSYNIGLVILSVAIAVGASIAALWLAFQFRSDTTLNSRGQLLKFASAFIMGFAIVGMHYTGMAAARFMPHGDAPPLASGSMSTLPLALAIVCGTLVILGFTLISSLFDRRFTAQGQALADSAARYQSLLHYHSDAVLEYDLSGNLLDANLAAGRMLRRDVAALRRDGLVPLLTPDGGACFLRHLRGAIDGELQEYDLALTPAPNRQTLLHMRNVPLVIKGQIVGVFAIGTDITDRARALEALQRNKSELQAMVEQQQHLLETIQQLSMPVLPVHDRVLLMPLIGNITGERSQQMMITLLQNVEQQRAQTVIIDITGVSLIDTLVAGNLIQTVRAVSLLGAETVLVGITPEVAQTLVQLGVDLSQIAIRSNLEAGVAYAIASRARQPASKALGG
jgi:NO-binding membrane sensor protein with MHYT domain/anti-anti-sigma regulatory factor